MNKSFYKKIINLIPSADLKNCVFQNNYQFTEKDLLKFILRCAPTFKKKLELFKEATLVLEDKMLRRLAQKRIDFENKQYDAFMQAGENIVYEIEIKTAPNAADEETYLTKSFDDAVAMIKLFIKCYDIKAGELTEARYTIKKKTTNLPQSPRDIYNDKVGALGECVLDNKFRIIYLDMYHSGNEVNCKNGVDCNECNRCISSWFTTHYPHFLQHYDLIAYYDDPLYNPTHLLYGIFDSDMEKYDFDTHVINILDNRYIQNRNADFIDENGYYRIYDAHSHPDYYEVFKPDLKDVPQKVLDDYNYALPVLKKIEEEIKARK